jgi:hypothetical protein
LIVQQQPQQQEGTPDVAAVPTKEEPRRIDPIVVTATMSPTSLEKLGAAVTVITGEEITNLNFDRIEDVFRQVPGVQVQSSGSPGKATSLSIRGGIPARAGPGRWRTQPHPGRDRYRRDHHRFDRAHRDRPRPAIDALRCGRHHRGGQHHHQEGPGLAQRQRVGGGRQLQGVSRAGDVQIMEASAGT